MNIYGGGATTNEHGLKFEKDTSLANALIRGGYYVSEEGTVRLNLDQTLGHLIGKHALYGFLKSKGVDWSTILSKKLLPDEAFYNVETNTLYIVEKKFQQVAGSVDEKLQTCDFKKKQYQRLVQPFQAKVEYAFLLSDFFNKDGYRDVFKYITDSDCHYFFNVLPLNFLGLKG